MLVGPVTLLQAIPFQVTEFTEIVAVADVAELQTPLVTTALKYLVVVNDPIAVLVKVLDVSPEILVKVILSVEDCH